MRSVGRGWSGTRHDAAPVSSPEPALPDGYDDLLEQLKSTVATARWRAQRVVNTELLLMYWRLGNAVLGRQREEGWGTRVIDRLATDLRAAFPDMRGLSRSNIKYMRQMAGAWSEEAIGQQAVGQLPWGHVTVLLDKVNDQMERDWYVATAAQQGWSRNVLQHQIMNQLHRRIGAAPPTSPTSSLRRTASWHSNSPATRTSWTSSTSPPRSTSAISSRPLSSESKPCCSSSATASHSLGASTTSRSMVRTSTSTYCSSTGRRTASSSSNSRSAALIPPTSGSSAFTSRGSTQTCASPTTTPQPSASCSAPAATTTWSVTRWASATAPLAVANYTYDTLPPAVREVVPTSEQLVTAVTAALSADATLSGRVSSPTTATALSAEATLTVGGAAGQAPHQPASEPPNA